MRRRPARAPDATQPGVISPEPKPRRNRPGGRFPCSVLHRARFFVPRTSQFGRWALTPPFHPCPLPCGPLAVCFLRHFLSTEAFAPASRGFSAARCLVVSGLSSNASRSQRPFRTRSRGKLAPGRLAGKHPIVKERIDANEPRHLLESRRIIEQRKSSRCQLPAVQFLVADRDDERLAGIVSGLARLRASWRVGIARNWQVRQIVLQRLTSKPVGEDGTAGRLAGPHERRRFAQRADRGHAQAPVFPNDCVRPTSSQTCREPEIA